MRTRDERVKRERQIDRTSGWLERNRRERRTREAAIYASQKSTTNRARPLNEESLEKRGRRRKNEELKERKIELTAYHTEKAKSIERKLLSYSSEYDIK